MTNWEKLYSGSQKIWGKGPRPIIISALEFLKPGNVLDLGAGEGQNGLFLVEKGFDFIAVDKARSSKEKILKLAKQKSLESKVKVIIEDISKYNFDRDYDNIISCFSLHFLDKEDFSSLISKIKDHTSAGGINVITDFTQEGSLYDNKSSKGYWLKSNELKDIYSDWEVIHYGEKEGLTLQKDDNGSPYKQKSAEIIARKPV